MTNVVCSIYSFFRGCQMKKVKKEKNMLVRIEEPLFRRVVRLTGQRRLRGEQDTISSIVREGLLLVIEKERGK